MAVISPVTGRDMLAPKVAILLCTFNGQQYLQDQLHSFAAQTHSNWQAWTSDDGSQDNTHSILAAHVAAWGADRMSVHFGPSKGFVANFLSLACKAEIEADFYAYSDQDDVWESDKLERALAWLKLSPRGCPAVYCSRTRLVDSDNNDIGMSPLFTRRPSFANALMQSIGGGNTMVFNKSARDLLCLAGEDVDVITHDWWTYLVVAGCGGRVFYDPFPTLRYRQHSDNLVGSNVDLEARIARISMLWHGRFKDINDRHIRALERISHRLTGESRTTLDEFCAARGKNLFSRAVGFLRSGIHRQTFMGNIGLVVATLFKKM